MTGKEILEQQFDKSGMHGYRMDQVDAFLQQIAAYVEEQDTEKNDLSYKMQILADKIEEYKKDEENIREALLGAQKLGSSVVNEAKAKAEAMTREAKASSEEMLRQAKAKVESMTKDSLQKANLELSSVHRECDMEQRRLERIKQEVSSFRATLLKQYKQHLDLLANLPVSDEPTQKVEEPAPEEKAPEEKPAEEEKKDTSAEETEVVTETISSDVPEEVSYEEEDMTKEFKQEKSEKDESSEEEEDKKKSAERASGRPNYLEKFGELKFGGFNNSKK